MNLKGIEARVRLDSDTSEYKDAEVKYSEGSFNKSLDACGVCCPGPLMKLNEGRAD